MKTILVVLLLSGQNNLTPLYYTEFTEATQCEKEKVKVHQAVGLYPLRRAYCVEFKK